MAPSLLEIRNLGVSFATRHGPFAAVDGFDLTLDRNEVLAIVGESGSGKSVAMLADSREFIQSDPWIVALPGLAILITVLAINLTGDGLRDALDPKMRRG